MRVLGLLIAAGLLAHEWYPSSCCSDTDCHPIACATLSQGGDGLWHYRPPYGSGSDVTDVSFKTATPSPDNQCHACWSPAIQGQGQGRCLFIPVRTT